MRVLGMGLILMMAVAAWAEDVTVTLQKGAVKAKADHMSKTVAVVRHGDVLKITEKENDWFRVTTPSGKTGWIHESATVTKTVEINKDTQVGSTASSSNDEVGLAGKGYKQGSSGKLPASTTIPKVKDLIPR